MNNPDPSRSRAAWRQGSIAGACSGRKMTCSVLRMKSIAFTPLIFAPQISCTQPAPVCSSRAALANVTIRYLQWQRILGRVKQVRQTKVHDDDSSKSGYRRERQCTHYRCTDGGDLAGTGVIPGSINISLGTLFYKADQNMPAGVSDARLADKSQEIFVTCAKGGQASIAAGVLNDYGYENVSVIDGGIVGWKEAGLDTEDAE